MQVLDSHVGPLTNTEVMDIIKQQLNWHKNEENKHNGSMPSQHRLYPTVWISKEINSYLNDTNCIQNNQDLKKLLNDINKFDTNNNLTRLEKLQIINLLPSSQPLLHSIINQFHKKFTKSTDGDRLIEIISKYRQEEEEEDEDEEEEEEEEEEESS